MTVTFQKKVASVTLANLNRNDPNDTLRAGQRLVLHAQEAGSTAAAESADGRRVTYVVRRGDTLSDIARTLRVTVASLREWNNISGSSIRAVPSTATTAPSITAQ